MAGNSAIWRATTNGAENNNSGDVIEFNGGAVPDSKSHIINTHFQLISSISTNERPKVTGDLTQDLGFSQLDVIITGSFSTPSSHLGSGIIKKWLIEAKTNTAFPFGRFGLRLNDYPQFNLTPSEDRGYILYDSTLTRSAEYQKVDFVFKLRFNGSIGVSPYSW